MINCVALAAFNIVIVTGVQFHLEPGLIHLGQSRLEDYVLILDQEGLLGRFLVTC